jgi:hypothetical protein
MSVRKWPGVCLRLWCSPRYQRISPLHREFLLPLHPSSPAVSNAALLLSNRISHPTNRTTWRPFTPNKSGQRLRPSYYRGCWHEVCNPLFHRYAQSNPKRLDLFPVKSSLQTEALLPARGVARSGFRPLSNILDCGHP